MFNIENLKMFSKKAFTLSEVLITLGVIGVVAAITLPSVMNNFKAQKLKTQFQKSYSTVSNALLRMYTDGYLYDPSEYNSKKDFYKYMLPYLKGAYDCGTTRDDKGKSGICFNKNDSSQKGYYSLRGTAEYERNGWTADGQIALIDGSLIMFYQLNEYEIRISIDINGYNNPPNRFGYDTFVYLYTASSAKTGKLAPYSNSDGSCEYDISTTHDNHRCGLTCTKYVLRDPNYFKTLLKYVK